MSRPSRRSMLNRYADGSPCQRAKPCTGKLKLDHDWVFFGASLVFQVWRCSQCGKKHYSKARKAA